MLHMATLPKYVGSIRDEIILSIFQAKRPMTTKEITSLFPDKNPAMIRMLLSGYVKCETNPIIRVARAQYDVIGRDKRDTISHE